MTKHYYLSIATNVLHQNDGATNFFLDYYLLEQQVTGDNGIGLMGYGVEIVKRMNNGDKSEISDQIAIGDIFFSKPQTIEFINQLAHNCVTPTTLLDVVEDVLNDQEAYPNTLKFLPKAV